MANPPKGGDAKLRVYTLSRIEQGMIASRQLCHLTGRPLGCRPIFGGIQPMRKLRVLLAPILACIVLLGPTLAPAVVSAANLSPAIAPSLGTASSFVVLAGSTVTD